MRLNSYLSPELVLTHLEASDVPTTLERLAEHLQAAGVVDSAEEVERGLLAREQAHTTAMGHGMAIPHATIRGLAAPVLLVALAPTPVQFGPAETDPVAVFFVLLSPPGHESLHIKLLARICRLARHPGFLDELRDARTGEDALRVIERVDEQHV